MCVYIHVFTRAIGCTCIYRVGRWYAILQWLNIIGVITNAFLIAYVSRWGTRYDKDPEIQLWIVLGFEVSARACDVMCMQMCVGHKNT